MIFLGDIAFPVELDQSRLSWPPGLTGPIVANLEGPVSSSLSYGARGLRLCNHPSVVPYLQRLGACGVTLANNHILDLTSDISETTGILDRAGIKYCGAGATGADASRPMIIEGEGETYVIVAFGWEVIGCRAAEARSPGINPLRPDNVLETVEKIRASHPAAIVVLMMHWNYELEVYPQPLHRQLAFRAIDLGANAVIGSHSHSVEGVEVYKGAPIAYGLGNWLVADGLFLGGRLRYPAMTRRQMAFEWQPNVGKMRCHWFEFNPDAQAIGYVSSESLQKSKHIATMTPFRGLDHADYVEWFKENRRKRKLLPIYRDYRHVFRNHAKDLFVAARGAAIQLAVNVGIKGGPH